MKPNKTATGFGSDQEKENPQGVIEAHAKVQQFIEAQINGVTFYDYGKLGFDGFKSFCQMKKDIIFGTTPEKMADAYLTLEEYGQRVTQWIMDKYRTPNDRYLSKAGELLLNFINQQLGITVQPKIKTPEELMIEKAMIDIHREIRQRVKPEELDSDKIMDEIKRTAPEDRKYEDELLVWYRKVKEMSEDKLKEFMKKNIPEEFQTDLEFLCKQNRSGHHYHYEDIEDMIPGRRRKWRKEKIIREMMQTHARPRINTSDTDTPPENEDLKELKFEDVSENLSEKPKESESDSSEEALADDEIQMKLPSHISKILGQGKYPIVPLKLKPIENFYKLEAQVRKAYAKKEGISEKEIFVEDASTLGEFKTEADFYQNPSKTHREGAAMPLEKMLVDETGHALIRISIKDKGTKWRSCEKNEKGNWEIKPYPGKIFTEKDTADVKLLDLDDVKVKDILKKWEIKDWDTFKKNLPRFVGNYKIHLANLSNGLVIRVSFSKKDKTEYLWFDLMPLLAD